MTSTIVRNHMESKLHAQAVNLAIGIALLLIGSFLLKEFMPRRTPIQANPGTIRLGWESFFPYQFEQGSGESRRQSGVDTELLREAFQRAGYRLTLVDKDWARSLEEIRRGTLQGVSLAFRNPEREQFAYFSLPYFSMRSAVCYRRHHMSKPPASCEQLLQLLRQEKYTVGYTQGYSYVPQLQAVLEHPEVKPHSQASRVEADNIRGLINGHVDLVVADQLSATSLIMKNGWGGELDYVLLDVPAQEVTVMLSKKSVPPEVVERLNQAILSMEADGTRAAIVRAYYYPTLLSLLAQDFLFDQISILATAAAALSGIFLARKEGCNIIGAFLLAAAPAAGGGLLRDLIAGRRPVAVVDNPSILMTVLWMVLAGFLVFRLVEKYSTRYARALDELDVDNHPVLVFFDSLGLAAFTVLGVLVAMQWRCEPLWLWGPLLAAITNGGGSLLRDILRNRQPELVTSTIPYVDISIAWGFILSQILTNRSAGLPSRVVELKLALVFTLIGVGLTRYLFMRYKVRSSIYGALTTTGPKSPAGRSDRPEGNEMAPSSSDPSIPPATAECAVEPHRREKSSEVDAGDSPP